MKSIRLLNTEQHPFEPFLPAGTKVLMLGSFPPARSRWSIDFYYPNIQNDLWRIMGLIFEGDKNHFICPNEKRFNKNRIITFLNDRGIALSDTAKSVIRLKENASDKFLEVVEPMDLKAQLLEIPDCRTVVATGQKAAALFCSGLNIAEPKTGQYSSFRFEARAMRFYRMPSSSRAYPKALEEKAAVYECMFREIGIL